MGFFNNADNISLIIIISLLTFFLYLKRKNLQTHKFLYPLFYFCMLRTKFGLQFMDSISKKFRKLLVFLGYLGIIVGFMGMIIISSYLIVKFIPLITDPKAPPSIQIVAPINIPGIFYIPPIYWIISIFIIALVHEMAHGVIARAYDLKVKSSGFAFLGVLLPIIPAAFVEPDEKKLKKRPYKEQLSIFAAGPFSNIIFGFIFLAVGLFVLAPIAGSMIEPNGVFIKDYVEAGKNLPAESAKLKGQVIKAVDSAEIQTIDDLSKALASKKPGQSANVKTDKGDYRIKLAQNPKDASKAYLGAYLEDDTISKSPYNRGILKYAPPIISWFYTLFMLLFMLNLGVGLFNLVPLGPLDGGRMFQLVLYKMFEKEKADRAFKAIGLMLLAIVAIHIVFAFIRPA